MVGFDASDPTRPSHPDVTAVATACEMVYVSADRLYLATRLLGLGRACCWDVRQSEPQTAPTPAPLICTAFDARRHRHDVRRLRRGRGARSRTAGRWTRRTACCGSRSGPTLADRRLQLDRDARARAASDLVEVGRVDRLGVGEEIKSVRWFDDLAVVVTFRQTDPFYADRPDRPVDAASCWAS